MVLTAENSVPGFKTYSWQLSELFWQLDPAAEQDRKFSASITNSLSEGMKFPILVAEQDVWKEYFMRTARRIDLYPKPIDVSKKYRVVLGNNRCNFAVKNGFTSIDGVLSSDLDKDYTHYLRNTLYQYGIDYGV